MLLAGREQQAEGAIRIENLPHVGDSNGHARAIFLGDALQPFRLVESPRATLADLESNHWTLSDDVEHSTRLVRPILLPKAS